MDTFIGSGISKIDLSRVYRDDRIDARGDNSSYIVRSIPETLLMTVEKRSAVVLSSKEVKEISSWREVCVVEETRTTGGSGC
jgi:hypothetical protein